MIRVQAEAGRPIYLGRVGENNAREIAFDFGNWLDAFGAGSVQLMVRRPGEETIYPVALREEGNLAIWTVTDADVAIAGRSGECELSYTTESGTMIKGATWTLEVRPSIDGDITEPPEAAESWLNELRNTQAATEQNAKAAEEFAAEAEEWAKKAASSGGGGTGGGTVIDKITADDVTFKDGDTFQQKYDSGELSGPSGKDGANGKDGKDGNGIENIERTDGDGSAGTTDTYTVTTSDGRTYDFTVYNGKDGSDGTGGSGTGADGKDGITPHIGDNLNWFIGDTDTGIRAKGEDGKDGKDGKAGANGITPHIGDNKNWFIGETDTGIRAEGKDGKDGVGGGSSLDVYSTEETVVGTWIDGKPIYRRTFVVVATSASSVVETLVTSEITTSNVHIVDGNAVCCDSIHNHEIVGYTAWSGSANNVSRWSTVLLNASGLFVCIRDSEKHANTVYINVSYTKYSDTATNGISTTALMDAYEEGVNEA